MARLNKTPLTLRVRRGTAAQITATSPAPYQKEGELAYATDTKSLYISDGSVFNLFRSLSEGYNGEVLIDGKTITIVNGLIINIV